MPKTKVYLGDAVYARFDGYYVILTTENGVEETNRIFLDPGIYRNLQLFVESITNPDSENLDG